MHDDAERLIAWLRIVAIPVLLLGHGLITEASPSHRAFVFAVVSFSVYAVLVLIGASIRDVPPRVVAALAALDIAFAGLLAFTTGGGFSQIRFAFVFVPVSAAFRRRPRLTLCASVASVLVYVIQALSHPSRSNRSDAVSFVLVQASYLAWIGAAATLLSALLARRERVVQALLLTRQRLVVEALAAEDRERKRLSEDLHDGPLQTLLAARHELEEVVEPGEPGPGARALEAITSTITGLRQQVSALHPHLIDQVGLEPALRQAGERASRRGNFRLVLELERDGASPNDNVLYRCASEMLANAATHASASLVTLRLGYEDGQDVLEVSDNGVGFDPDRLDERLREGHIGVLSLRERAEGLGGVLRIDAAPGRGARLELRLPRDRSRQPVV
ncbi:MAG TPA: ATP-binding protein [Gaiellales bacterium]|jgi:two-component system NarL family sensor kinase